MCVFLEVVKIDVMVLIDILLGWWEVMVWMVVWLWV